MANATPLTTDYDVEWLNTDGYQLPEGTTHEHGYVHLDNGYTVSVLRSNVHYETVGYQEGLWEAVAGRPATGLAKMLGMDYEPASELEELYGNENLGAPVAGPFDSAGVSGFIAKIAEQPSFKGEEESA